MIKKVYFSKIIGANNYSYTKLSHYNTNLEILLQITPNTMAILSYKSATNNTSLYECRYEYDPHYIAEVDVSDINNFLEKIDGQDPVVRRMIYKLVRNKLKDQLNDKQGCKKKNCKKKS